MQENAYSFRCAPLVNCNAFGWDILLPQEIRIVWNGGTSPNDLKVLTGDTFAKSNFGHGTVTFHVGYTWHTPSGWSLLVGPLPNFDHGPIRPLSALIETDVLKYPFFPSARLREPGEYLIPAATPICRVIPVQISPALDCEPSIEPEPREFNRYRAWQSSERRKLKESTNYIRIKQELPFKSGKLGWKKFYQGVAKYPIIRMKNIISVIGDDQPKLEITESSLGS